MKNYFSKFSLEENPEQIVHIDLKTYRRQHVVLTLIIYIMVFIMVSLTHPQVMLELILKIVALVVGFGLHSYLQFKFSKQLNQDTGLAIEKGELLKIHQRYEPKVIFLLMFLFVYFAQNYITFPVYRVSIVILIVPILWIIKQLVQDESI